MGTSHPQKTPLEEALHRPNCVAAVPAPGGVLVTFRTSRPDGTKTYHYESSWSEEEILALLEEAGFLAL